MKYKQALRDELQFHKKQHKAAELDVERLNKRLLIAESTPMQPISNGRFKENKIVNYCLDNSTDMNDIATQDFSEEDREQFAQLIGYSLSGYGELSYVSDKSYYRADSLNKL